uniref:NADH dehydrogenase [ubiquinone] 1 alpha subcomplex subunit 2 n=1 Tax=Timema poppense TaxID=170557 RepID=A0A7R9DJ27_TIMPO|nr:unnamed protein product [Timema poppensis]
MRIFEETCLHSSAFKRYTYLLVKGFFHTQLVKLYSINMAARNALKIGSKVKELRIHLCQKSDASKGVRDFIEQYYVNLKKSNPKFPILIRECSGVQPRVYARYELGKESSVPLSNLKAEEVLQKVELLAK